MESLVSQSRSRGENDEALNYGSIRFILPQDVLDWTTDKHGRLNAVKIRYKADTRDSIKVEANEVYVYQVFTIDGWVKYTKDEKGNEKEIERGSYGKVGKEDFRYRTTNDPNTWQERLPLKRYEVPVRANIGYIMARKANAIYNMESARDFLLWVACFPKAMLDVLNEDKSLNRELLDELKKAIEKGSNVWPGKDHDFKGPPVDGAEIRNATLEIKQKQFMKTFFQVASDQAVERTAAEAKIDFKMGIEAYLGSLATVLDEIVNDNLFLLEQVNFPGDRNKWGNTHVERSKDFSHIDPDAEIDRAIARWVPSGTLPATEDMILDLVLRAAERDRISIDDDQIESLKGLIRQSQDQQTQADDVFSTLRRRRAA